MILADTSVWIEHLRHGQARLAQLLEDERIIMHPFIIGELALGSLKKRDLILSAMYDLPAARMAADAEVMHFVEIEIILGRGIGYVDAHLLASIRSTPGTSLWTHDKRLHAVAEQLGLCERQ